MRPETCCVFYGGKGGVGKTTCAAAWAIAEAARGRRVLVVSTDPAHSLGDALKKRLSSRPTPIAVGRTSFDSLVLSLSKDELAQDRHRSAVAQGFSSAKNARGTLRALELDARRAFVRWLTRHRQPLGDILEQGTWLGREDVEALLDLSIPGIDELAGLLEITRLSRTGDADVVVVDTAPTGHTLRLLAAPEAVGAVARLLDALHEEHRLIRDQLARVGRPEASDRLIELLADEAREMAGQLRDRRRTTVRWITLPEALSVAEAADAVAALERSDITVPEIIVNRVLPDGGPCPLCDKRRVLERRVIARIRKVLGRGREVRLVHAQLDEPIGVNALARIGRTLLRSSSFDKRRMSAPKVSMPLVVSRSNHERAAQAEALDAFKGAKLLFFAGKGGVGKTTVAAASAVRLARANPERRVLLMSTDPAHSLGDVFAADVGDRASRVEGGPANLSVREVNAAAVWTARRAAVESALDELAATLGSRSGSQTTARVSELMDLAPPGVDELFGVLSVFEAREDHDAILVDTAPTGHALRLLAMPDVVREWVQALLRVLLKYRALLRPGQLAAELVEMSRSIRDLETFLRTPRYTRFIVVTRPAEVPAAETDRLLRRLRRMRLAVTAIVANATTTDPGGCGWCRATAAAERRQLRRLERSAGGLSRAVSRGSSRGCAIIQTPPPARARHAAGAL